MGRTRFLVDTMTTRYLEGIASRDAGQEAQACVDSDSVAASGYNLGVQTRVAPERRNPDRSAPRRFFQDRDRRWNMSKRKEPPRVKDRIPRDPACNTEPWVDFFNRLQAAGGRLSAADVERLIHFWKTWPGRWAEAYPGTNACVLLELQHGVATRLLMAEAEWRGMDSGPLAISARLCHAALTQSPDVGNWPNPGRGTWPECLEAAKKVTMRPDQAAALSAAEVLLERLAAVAGAEQGVELITLAQAVTESNISRTTVRKAVKAGRLTDYRPANKRGTTSPLILDRAEVERLVSRTCVKKKPASK